MQVTLIHIQRVLIELKFTVMSRTSPRCKNYSNPTHCNITRKSRAFPDSALPYISTTSKAKI